MDLELVLGERVTEGPGPLGPLLLDGWIERRDDLAGALAFGPGDAVERCPVERDHNSRDAAGPECGDGPDPGRVGRGGDEDRGHPAPQAARRLDERVDE